MHKKASPACELRKDGRASQATSDGDSDAEDESDADSDGNLRGLVVKDDEASSSDPETSEDESIEASARKASRPQTFEACLSLARQQVKQMLIVARRRPTSRLLSLLTDDAKDRPRGAERRGAL